MFVPSFGFFPAAGDYFLLTKESAGLFDRVWDRGSFVAVSPGDRAAYVSVLRQLLRPGGAVLLSSLNRAAGTTEAMERGPPFSVTSAHLDDMFGDWCRIEKLDSVDLLATAGDWERFRDAGLTSLLEEIHLITRL